MNTLPETQHPKSSDEERLHYFADYEPPTDDFMADTLAGLSASPKTHSPKYFYDQKGSALFDEICRTPEYYVTRTEMALLDQIGPEVAGLTGPDAVVIEWGSGSSWKIRKLLDALDNPAEYIAIDISRDHLLAASAALVEEYPSVKVGAICADFVDHIELPPEAVVSDGRKLGFLPGSTIGNFEPETAARILRRAAKLLGPGGALLIGADLQKDEAVLKAAYDDAGGMTAAFNLNLLDRMATELGAKLTRDDFAHEIRYNRDKHRIEMHLRAVRATTIEVGGKTFTFEEGETIHTENSHKFTIEGFQAIAAQAGFQAEKVWTDPENLFSLHYLTLP